MSAPQDAPVAFPAALYSETSARCWCQDTITLRTDGVWWHGPLQGFYCRAGKS